MSQPGLNATEPGLTATEPAIIDFDQDYLQSLNVKKTNVFLTAVLVRLSEPETVGFQVKKVGKDFIVNLSNSEMSFLTTPTNSHNQTPVRRCVYLQIILVEIDYCRLVAVNPGSVAINPGSNEIIVANNPG